MGNIETEPLRTCRECGLNAYSKGDLDMFSKKKHCKYDRDTICKSCKSKQVYINAMENKDRTLKKNREWHNSNKKILKSRKLKCKYGITLDEYNDILESQDYSCAICNTNHKEFSRMLAVDHCHTTGNIRGLLCSKCNTAIGLLNDDTDIMSNAILYLEGA